MFNLLKIADKTAGNYEAQLQAQNKADKLEVDGLLSGEKQLETVRDNDDLIDATEVQFGNKRGKVAETITQHQLDNGKTTLTTLRDDTNEKLPTPPLGVLNQAQEAERTKAFKAAEVDGDTSFWDKYVDDDLLGDATKMIGRMGPSQLANNADRFKGTSTDPTELSTDITKLVMAGVRDADAALFHVFYKAAGRDLTAKEQQVVDGITQDKITLLAQCAECGSGGAGVGGIDGSDGSNELEIMKLHKFVSDPKVPHDERWEAASQRLSQLIDGNGLDRSPVQPPDQASYGDRHDRWTSQDKGSAMTPFQR
jgi:hypothetical protein